MSTTVELSGGALALPISAVTAADVALAGGKGANLGELQRAGFRIPDAFLLTTAAYDLAAREAAVDPADLAGAADRLKAMVVPDAVARAARDGYAALGGGPVA